MTCQSTGKPERSIRGSAGRRTAERLHEGFTSLSADSVALHILGQSWGRWKRPNRSLALLSAQQMLSICPFWPAAGKVSALILSGAALARSYGSANWRPSMTFKSERRLEGRTLVLKLSGRVQAEHLEQLRRELPTDGSPAALDLTDVTLVDVVVVRYLAASEARGVRLYGLSGFIREWISREEKPSARPRKRKKQKK
jgi:hypothetical protein